MNTDIDYVKGIRDQAVSIVSETLTVDFDKLRSHGVGIFSCSSRAEFISEIMDLHNINSEKIKRVIIKIPNERGVVFTRSFFYAAFGLAMNKFGYNRFNELITFEGGDTHVLEDIHKMTKGLYDATTGASSIF